MNEKPAIVLRHHGAPDPAVLRQVCAGAEEEGVPIRDETRPASGATALAHGAALASVLEVGIGIGADGTVAVHHASLPEADPVVRVPSRASAAELRVAGRTAARIVKTLPL